MAIRNIVKIDEEKCNGCGECVIACAEGAIEIIDGKAKLISETYCDGLGACLGNCPQDAITIEQREAAEFDEKATEEHLAQAQKPQEISTPSAPTEPLPCGCPGTAAQTFDKKPAAVLDSETSAPSQLSHWPVQMMLVSPDAPYFKNADLLWAADCVPFAMADFHQRFLAGRAVAVGCPKLDNADFYIEKLAKIIQNNSPKSLTVVHMEVPCCFGMSHIAKEAIAQSGVELPFEDITVDLRGNIIV